MSAIATVPFLAVGRIPGADIAPALDYRGEGENASSPRVVGRDFWTEAEWCHWRVVADGFSAFVELLRL